MQKSNEPIDEDFNFVQFSSKTQLTPATLDDIRKEYEDNYSKYLSYARLLSSNQMAAEDLVQQAFSNTVKQIKKGNTINTLTLGGYLKSSVRNLSIKSYKKENAQPKLHLVEESEKAPDVLHLLSADKKLLMESIAKLIPSQRTVTIMYYFDGLKVEEIASELGLSQSAVKTNLARARQHLFDSVAPLIENKEEDNG